MERQFEHQSSRILAPHRSRPHRPTRHPGGRRVARSGTALIAAAIVGAMITGCAGRRPPTFQVVAVDQRGIGDSGIALDFTVEGTNPNNFELPLRDVRYSVGIEGAGNFDAIRSAEATLPRRGSQRFVLPAIVPIDAARQLEDFVAYQLTGTVEYRFPDPLSDVLFDASVRRPSAGIGIAGRLDFTGTEVREAEQ